MGVTEVMTSRDQRIYEEAVALWDELFDDPPPAMIDGGKLLELITSRVGDPAYRRLRSPFLRPSTITMPKSMSGSADAS